MFLLSSSDQLVCDKEFTAEHKEQYNTDQKIRSRCRNLKLCLDRIRSTLQHSNKHGDDQHPERIHLRKPGHRDRCKSDSARRTFRNGIIGTRKLKHSHKTAECTGEKHRPSENASHIDAGISGGIIALTDNCDFISLLGLIKVNISQYYKNKGEYPAPVYPENFCEARARHEHIDFGETAAFQGPFIRYLMNASAI